MNICKDIILFVVYLYIQFLFFVGYVYIMWFMFLNIFGLWNRIIKRGGYIMKKVADFICKHKVGILIITGVLFVLSLVGMKLTSINYDILVYLPSDIETVQGQNILKDDFDMGAYSIVVAHDMDAKEMLSFEDKIRDIDGVAKVVSLYDVVGTSVPIDFLPDEITSKMYKDDTSLLFVTFEDSTSSDVTINAVSKIRDISSSDIKVSGLSSMVLDTMNLSNKEIVIYVVIAVLLCLLVLELSLDSYLAPVLLLLNIGIAIVFNMGSNIVFGEISYITKALVAILQLGVTTDFSIFLYHSYADKVGKYKNKSYAMSEAIVETFTSVIGSALTTMAGFLVLCTMNLTLGKDLGLVMAKGVFLGVVCVLTVFASLLLCFDKGIEATRHKKLSIKFDKFNGFIIKHYKAVFVIFLLLLVPAYIANSKVDVYYKIDESLPKNLESIVANKELKDKFGLVSTEIILVDKNMKSDEEKKMVDELSSLDGIDMVLSFSKLSDYGITLDMLPNDVASIFNSNKYKLILLNSTYDIATDELNAQIDSVNKIIKSYDEGAIFAGEGPLTKDLVVTSDKDFNNVNYSSVICIFIIMIFVLRSLLLPIPLIASIEFAIFVNMAISYFGGDVLPFVGPIVLGTIQLGATIDYAILLTTNYRNYRKKGNDKFVSMKMATDYCGGSILTSGLCFFAATFGVGLYSDLEMVGSLCTLISRGAIISMIVVLVVLPSILLIFDRFIMRGNGIMKNKGKKLVFGAFCISLLVPSSVLALNREETVYAKLDETGKVSEIIVNEHIINSKNKEVIDDYTDLENIVNINNDDPFTRDKNRVSFKTLGNDVFYQGTTTKELPVSLSISYKLDGKDIDLDSLLGQKGRVTIEFKYANNDKHVVNGSSLYTPFVVSTVTSIPNKGNSNVVVSNGKVIDKGNGYFVVGLSTPGLYESLDIDSFKGLDTVSISYDTDSFALSSVYSFITPKVIEESDLSVFDKMDSISSNVNELQSSINSISKGSSKLVDGSKAISDGSSLIKSKVDTILSKMGLLESSTSELHEGINTMIKTINSKKGELNNPEVLEKISAIDSQITVSKNEIVSLTTKSRTLKAKYDNYGLSSKSYDDILAMDDSNKMSLYEIKYDYENNYDDYVSAINVLTDDVVNLTTAKVIITSSTDSVNKLVSDLELYLGKLEDGSKKINDGTVLLKGGVSLLDSKMDEFNNGTKELSSGLEELNSGIDLFNKQGINKISKVTDNAMVYKNNIKSLIKLSNDYQTISVKDSSVSTNTKFVMVVEHKEKKEEIKKDVVKSEKTTFIDRVKNLFK